jgi:hypothetical protein
MKLLFKLFFLIIACSCKTPRESSVIVYRPNWSYEFNYSYYPSTTGTVYDLDHKQRNKPLVGNESSHGKLIMQVLGGMINGNQQTILYDYYDDETSIDQEATGLLENSSRIWIHPPRSNIFKDLEFAPFPFINFVKNEWRQEIVLDPNDWGVDSEVKSITVINKYIKREAEFIDTSFGRLNCVVIEAEGISDLGSSKLTIHYNNKYGFVYLGYHLIDGSKLDIELKKVYKS